MFENWDSARVIEQKNDRIFVFEEAPRFRTILVRSRVRVVARRVPLPWVIHAVYHKKPYVFFSPRSLAAGARLGLPPLPHTRHDGSWCPGQSLADSPSPSLLYWSSVFLSNHPVSNHAWPECMHSTVESSRAWSRMSLEEVTRVEWSPPFECAIMSALMENAT